MCFRGKRARTHPSTQSWSNEEMISLSAAAVEAEAIMTHGCALPGEESYTMDPQLGWGKKQLLPGKGRHTCGATVQLKCAWKCILQDLVLYVLVWLFLVFASLQQKDEVYLNLVLDYVPETVYRVARHYSRAKQTLPMVYVKVQECLFVPVTTFNPLLQLNIWPLRCSPTLLLHIRCRK